MPNARPARASNVDHDTRCRVVCCVDAYPGLPTSLMAYWPQVSGAPKAVSMLRAAACSRGNATCVVEHATEVKARNWTRVVSVDGHKFAAGIGLQLLLECASMAVHRRLSIELLTPLACCVAYAVEDVNKNGVYDAGDDNFLSALDFSDPQLRWLPMTLEELHPNDNTTVLRLNASTVVIGKGIVALTYSATSNRVADPDYADSGGYLIPRCVQLSVPAPSLNPHPFIVCALCPSPGWLNWVSTSPGTITRRRRGWIVC